MSDYRAADLLVDMLIEQNISRAFCVPGESYLSVLDSFQGTSEIEIIAARHEGGAGFMALADAKLSGKPGVCFVSRGPGAMNASISVHSARQDALPLIMFVGQVARQDLGRQAFQEVDYVTMWSDMAKWVCQVSDATQLEETLRRAFQIAQDPTPGPVVIVLPEDMLEDPVAKLSVNTPTRLARISHDPAVCREVQAAIAKAQRPLIIAGQALNTPEGRAALDALATQYHLPVAVSFRQQDLLANDHPSYAGHLFFNAPKQLTDLLSTSDLILAIGTRLGDVTTQGYQLPTAPHPTQTLIHVYPDSAQLGRVFDTDLAIVADPAAFCQSLAALAPAPLTQHTLWRDKLATASRTMNQWKPKSADDGVVFGEVVTALNDIISDDAIICVDAGNFSGWVQKHLTFQGERRMVSTISGSMGSAVPAGVAASLRYPSRQVVVFVGDGGFMMTGAELATARQYGANLKVIISDNRSYGTIRLHQELHFPDRISATNLSNPNFTTLGNAYGIASHTITLPQHIQKVLEQAFSDSQSALVAVDTSLEHISAFASLTQIAARRA